MNTNCHQKIKIGGYLRLIATAIALIVILKTIPPTYWLLILPIALMLLDSVDTKTFYSYSKTAGLTKTNCNKLFMYQQLDKIMDVLSYIMVYVLFDLDKYFLGFLIWRIIGVIIFSITKVSLSLIIMFDFMKEYLLYKYLFSSNYAVLAVAIAGKILFEWYFHTYHNKPRY